MCSEVLVNSPGNPWSQSWRSNGKLRCMLFHTKAVKGEVQWAFLLFSKVREFNFFKFIKSGIAIYAGPQAARLNTCYFHMSMDVGSNEAAYSSRFVPVESFQTQFGIFARSVVLSYYTFASAEMRPTLNHRRSVIHCSAYTDQARRTCVLSVTGPTACNSLKR